MRNAVVGRAEEMGNPSGFLLPTPPGSSDAGKGPAAQGEVTEQVSACDRE